MPLVRKHVKTFDIQKKKLDYTLLLAVVSVVVMGLIMVYDASVIQAYKDFGDNYFYIFRQLMWAAAGFGLLIFFAFFDYHILKKLSLPLLLMSILLLLVVFVPGLGYAAGGAHRWLRLGPLTVQPAEVIKLTSIIFFASLFEHKTRFLPFITIVSVISVIIGVGQRDLGSTIVFFLIATSLYVVAGAPLKYYFFLAPPTILAGLYFVLSSAYRKQRVMAFLDPYSDPQGYSYHILQVLIALGSGGIFGLGLGQSRQKFEYIPEVTTDSIFAILGEEFGMIGAIVLIGLLSFLVYKGFKIAQGALDNYGKLLAFGITMLLAIQTVVNLSAMVALIPLTGVPLPFVSYGGSAMLINLAAVGMLLNVSKNSKPG